MLLLTSTSDVVKVVTDAALAVDVHASYVDRASGADTPGRQNTAISTATTTTVVSAPASSTARNVRYLSIVNRDASTVNVTVQIYDGTNTIQIWKGALLAGWGVLFIDGFPSLLDGAGAPIISPLSGRLVLTTVLTTASATFTTQGQTKWLRIRGVGGGGAGAGCTSVASAASAGGGGGAGGYLEKTFLVTGNTGYAYTCGAGGTGVSGAAGNNGADSTFVNGGTTYTAKAGQGAVVATALTTLSSYVGGTGGTVALNGDVNVGGEPGSGGHITVVATPVGASGAGGSSPFGGGGVGRSTAGTGNAATGYGAGGGGAMTGASAAQTGGAASNGCWVVDEYS